MPQPQTRSVTKTRTRTRRFTVCHRHPSEPVTGFCALCLHDRLADLDSSTSGSAEVEKTVVCSRPSRGHGVYPATVPELRRSKSVAADKCNVVDRDVMDQRRKSCDVRARSSLSDLFVTESMKLGFSDVNEDEEIRVLDDGGDEIRVSDDFSVSDEGEKRTMKEMIEIEIELQNKRKNFWESASVFSQKLRKWRQKQKEKKECRPKIGQLGQFRDSQCQSEVTDYGLGRRSCDTEPRFSIDANRLSVDDPRCSFDEHRASWDGYMIARSIPRLTPIVDNSILAPIDRGMNPISEDGVSSGGSGQSNSDYRGSSSSSMKSSSTKTVGSSGEDGNLGSNARVSPANDVTFERTKLVITEKELKDWHLNSVVNENIESNSNGTVSSSKTSAMNGYKKAIPSRWKKVCNLWGQKPKLDDKKNVQTINSSAKLIRNASIVNSRNRSDQSCRDMVLDRNRSKRYSTSDINSGLLRLYLTPFRNTRRSKSGKNRGPFMVSNGFQLN
ncbi:protein OCTOPUS-like [Rutidosis leptorrhynchoides]|uniref:protein OCTOPUS-like n=1 Tax=Rutidosis leptorrhynchoides TaxID=125765 RepID=UPI003A9974E8